MQMNGTKAIQKIEVLLKSNWLPPDAVKAFEQAIGIIQECDTDSCEGDVTISLANGNELSPHLWVEEETIENATVHSMVCERCGAREVWWERGRHDS